MSFEPLTEERIETDSTYDAGTTTQLMWGARSDVGCVRPHNEDFPIAPASEVAPVSTPAPEPIDVSPQDDESTARVSEEPDSPTPAIPNQTPRPTPSLGDTAEIDVAAVEAKLRPRLDHEL